LGIAHKPANKEQELNSRPKTYHT